MSNESKTEGELSEEEFERILEEERLYYIREGIINGNFR